MLRNSPLARTMVELADTIVADFDVVEMLNLLVDRCVDTLHVDASGLMLASPDGELRVMAATNEAMRSVEIFAVQADEGPCVDCYHSGQPVSATDNTMVERWPRFGPVALAAGYHSVHAFPMRLRGTRIGALNLFNIAPREMTEDDVKGAQALADMATIGVFEHSAALEAQRLNEQLAHALNSRIVVEQAKGVIAERHAVDVVMAFSLLRSHARNHHVRLVDLAADVVAGKVLAPSPNEPTAS